MSLMKQVDIKTLMNVNLPPSLLPPNKNYYANQNIWQIQ